MRRPFTRLATPLNTKSCDRRSQVRQCSQTSRCRGSMARRRRGQMKGELGLADSFAPARPGQVPGRREARAAVAIAAGLYLVGAVLTATALLLPHVGSSAGVTAVALDAL